MDSLFDKILNLKFFEAIDVSNLKADGKGFKKIRFNPVNPKKDLALVPGWAQVVFNLKKGDSGAKNFLRLCCGYDSSQIREILKRVVPFTPYILDESKLEENEIYLFRIKRKNSQVEDVIGDLLAQVISKKRKDKNQIEYRFLGLKFPRSLVNYLRSNGTFNAKYSEDESGPNLSLADYDLILKDYIPLTVGIQ